MKKLIRRILKEEEDNPWDWTELDYSFAKTVFTFNPPINKKEYLRIIPILREMGVNNYFKFKGTGNDIAYKVWGPKFNKRVVSHLIISPKKGLIRFEGKLINLFKNYTMENGREFFKDYL